MRWLARRLAFYAFALWVALTINFLLPRLMPGDPLGGILQHISPSQIQANPGIVQTYQTLLGGGHHSIWHDYVTYLHRVVHFNFGISTSNYPAPVSDVVGSWKVCSPESVGGFTAVGYFFGRELHQKLNVPVGLIHTSWGGTPAEVWTSKRAMEVMPSAIRIR